MFGSEMTMSASSPSSSIDWRIAVCRRLSVAVGACGMQGLQPPFERGQRGGSALPGRVLDTVRGVGDSVFEIPDNALDVGVVGRQVERGAIVREGVLQASLAATGLGERAGGGDVVGPLRDDAREFG